MNTKYEHLNTGKPLIVAPLEIVKQENGKYMFSGIFPPGTHETDYETFSDAVEALFLSIEKRNGQHAGQMRADAARCLVNRSIGDLL